MENTGAHLASTWAQTNKVICTILSLLLFIAVLVFATGPWVAVPMVNVTAGNTADSKSAASSSMSGNPRDVEGFGDTADCGAGTKTVFGFPCPWSLELIENRLSSPRPRQDGFKLPWVLWWETLEISLFPTPWALRTGMAVTRKQWLVYFRLSPAASDMVFIIVARVFFPIRKLQYNLPLMRLFRFGRWKSTAIFIQFANVFLETQKRTDTLPWLDILGSSAISCLLIPWGFFSSSFYPMWPTLSHFPITLDDKWIISKLPKTFPPTATEMQTHFNLHFFL